MQSEAEAMRRPAPKRQGARKYLVRWTVILGSEEMQRLSGRPQALQKALDHVTSMLKGRSVEVYRIVPIEEVNRSARPSSLEATPKPNRQTGIAITEASSIEEVREMLERLVEGISFGGLPVPVRNYLEFEINPLMEVVRGGGEKA